MAAHLVFEFPTAETNVGSDPLDMGETWVRVFWDDVAEALLCYYYVPSSGSGLIVIPPETDIHYEGWRVGEISNYRFCDGSTLNYFQLTSDPMPFAAQNTVLDSAACVLSTVCDAYIQNPILVRNSESTTANGSVTIRGYSSAMGLEYTISNADEETPPISPAWQPSPTFTDLPPGNYIAHLRDSQGCLFDKPFTIEEIPDYNIRFTTHYKDALGSETVINILKRFYDGEPEDVLAGADPLVIKEGGGEMFTALRGQECVVSLLSSSFNQYIELFTGDDREFRVDVLKDGTLFWRGWIVPDMYLEPYLAPPYEMQFSATDGIGELKDKPFDIELPDGFLSQWDAIVHILKKADTQLPIIAGVNLYETRMGQSDADDPFKQSIISLEAYQDKGKVWDCAKVLEAILKPYGASIRQCWATWQIVRVEELKTNFTRRSYTWWGEFSFWSNYDPGRLITRPFEDNPFYWTERSQALELRPAFKKTEVHFDYALKTNLVKGGDIKAADFGEDGLHEFIDGTALYETRVIDVKEQQYALVLGYVTIVPDADYVQTERIWVTPDVNIELRIGFDLMMYDAWAFLQTPATPPTFLYTVRINDLYLNPPSDPSVSPEMEWTTTFYQFQRSITDLNNWQSITAGVGPIPEAGWLTIQVFEAVSVDFLVYAPYLFIKRIAAILEDPTPPGYAEDETFSALNPKRQFFIPETVEAYHGDVIPLNNAAGMYRNLILVNNNIEASLDWRRKGKTEATPILQLLANVMMSFRESPIRMLRGTLRGAFDWSQVLEEPDHTRYMPISFEYSDRRRSISGEFMELLGTQQVYGYAILDETGDPILSETGVYIEEER